MSLADVEIGQRTGIWCASHATCNVARTADRFSAPGVSSSDVYVRIHLPLLSQGPSCALLGHVGSLCLAYRQVKLNGSMLAT
jgi:hypothetical protein